MAPKAKLIRWSDFVGVRSRYQRSVHLERDAAEPDWLSGYVVTPLGRSLVSRVGAGLQPGGSARAWSLTGPYGSGKSAFALFLSHLFGAQSEKQSLEARELLGEVDDQLANRLFGAQAPWSGGEGLCPVLATGERRPIDQVLLGALQETVLRHWSGRGVKPSVVNKVVKLARRAETAGDVSSKEIVGLFEEVAAKVRSSALPGRGLLVVLDEAGKTLEHAAQSNGRGDIFLLQELAEAAARSGDTPIVLVLTLHQSFERYASKLGVAQRSEWAKVQGRFEDVAFQEAPDQVLRLIAAALDRTALPEETVAASKRAAKAIANLVKLPGVMKSHEFEQLLMGALPLHPATAMLLGPLFRSRLGQNERSLFAFLASTEPGGFQDFLCAAPSPKRDWPLFSVDQLYDYATTSFGTRLYEFQGRQWAEIETALRRLPEQAQELDVRIVKTIGVLGLIGEAAGLKASKDVLAACLGAQSASDRDELSRSLERLQTSSTVVYRKFRDTYQMWEGSDLDVDGLVAKALKELDQYQTISERVTRVGRSTSLVARRHLFETGTLRHFDVRYADESIVDSPFAEPAGESDGVVWLAIPSSAEALVALRKQLSEQKRWNSSTGKPVLVALPAAAESIRQLALEVAALEWVQLHTAELQADATARREVSARLSEAERNLRQELTRVLSGAGACDWFLKGRSVRVNSARDLARVLSDACDEAYHLAPAILNELLNRRTLSSAAAAARRSLMLAMSEQGGASKLGIEGFPPELSMYRSVLERHGLHRKRSAGWGFGRPREGERSLRPAYEAVENALRDLNSARVSIDKIYAALKRPPFGMKDGVLPVLVLAIILERESELALYEEGVFVASMAPAVIERLIRSPEKFELQLCEITHARRDLFTKLQALFARAGGDDSPALLTIVRELVRIARALPDFSRNTKTLSAQAQLVREALLRGREPGPLLFRELPVAVGLEPVEADRAAPKSAAGEMVERLRSSLRELTGAYPRLIDEIERTLHASFGLPPDSMAARTELEQRAQRLLPFTVDVQLKSFLLRAVAATLPRDEWLVALGTLLGGKPPESWHDRDAEQAKLNLGVIVGKFLRLESILIEQNQDEMPEGMSALRLVVTQPGQSETERVVLIRDADRHLLDLFCGRMRDVVSASAADLQGETLLAGVAILARELMVAQETQARPAEENDNGQ